MYGLISLEEQAVLNCQKLLSKIVQMKFKLDYIPILEKEWLNQKRYCVITYFLENSKVSFCVIFRKQKFHSFGTIHKGKSEDGETINIDDYDKVKNKVELLVYCYPFNNEIKFISIESLEIYKAKGEIFKHENKADRKIEWVFSCDLTRNIGEWING